MLFPFRSHITAEKGRSLQGSVCKFGNTLKKCILFTTSPMLLLHKFSVQVLQSEHSSLSHHYYLLHAPSQTIITYYTFPLTPLLLQVQCSFSIGLVLQSAQSSLSNHYYLLQVQCSFSIGLVLQSEHRSLSHQNVPLLSHDRHGPPSSRSTKLFSPTILPLE